MKDFGARLRKARDAERLSQDAVAAELGVTKGSLSAWENGRNFPQLDKFAQLCTLYRASADHLIFGTLPKHVPVAARLGEPAPEAYLSLDHRRVLDAVGQMTDKQRRGLLDLLARP
ncbi:helix-turn-helix transcriptional regulator [Pseudoxanthomonas sp. USHLN014]|uniref:helix-turn-helix domain-containing protein n=1 Tax=Pseudoxanthomonas sp. USHLN014 TaxID=3081297 RepID=UPI00301E5D32